MGGARRSSVCSYARSVLHTFACSLQATTQTRRPETRLKQTHPNPPPTLPATADRTGQATHLSAMSSHGPAPSPRSLRKPVRHCQRCALHVVTFPHPRILITITRQKLYSTTLLSQVTRTTMNHDAKDSTKPLLIARDVSRKPRLRSIGRHWM